MASASPSAHVIERHLNNSIHGNVQESDEILMGLGITAVLLRDISLLHHSEALIITRLISLLHYQRWPLPLRLPLPLPLVLASLRQISLLLH